VGSQVKICEERDFVSVRRRVFALKPDSLRGGRGKAWFKVTSLKDVSRSACGSRIRISFAILEERQVGLR
jgi:hypothetical protein